MEKTEMMKRYEAETGEILDIDHLSADANGSWCGYIEELEGELRGLKALNKWSKEELTTYKTKAAAYDRLMSCGLSMKELANILKHPVAIDNDEGQNTLYYFGTTPHIGQFSDGTQFWSCKRKWRLPRQLVHFNGDWTTSLTLPDGWEEA